MPCQGRVQWVILHTMSYIVHNELYCTQWVILYTMSYIAHTELYCTQWVILYTMSNIAHNELYCTQWVILHTQSAIVFWVKSLQAEGWVLQMHQHSDVCTQQNNTANSVSGIDNHLSSTVLPLWSPQCGDVTLLFKFILVCSFFIFNN